MDRSQLERVFQEKGVKKIKVGVFDIDGVLRGKYLSLEKFLYAVEKGFGFCDVIMGWDVKDRLYGNSPTTGWHTGYPDAWARIDLSTFRIIPWEPETACFLCDLYRGDGHPMAVAPRQMLQRVLAKAEQMNVFPVMSAEYEYFVSSESMESLREKGFAQLKGLPRGMNGYSWLKTSKESEFVHTIVDQMKAFDIEVETFHASTGPGFFTTAIRYDDALRAADKAALFKTAVKEVASQLNMTASFMSRLSPDLPGCRGHLHQSLWDRKDVTNLFYNPSARHRMSEIMRYYIGGQIKLMPQLTALVNPTINSYKRMLEGNWTPVNATWGVENRSTAIRVIHGSPKANRVEVRIGGADLNPYIAMATMLAAGLYGIENRIDPPDPVTGNAFELARDASALPRNLAEATALLKGSDIARELLGDEFVEHYVRTREWEVREFQRAVTDWELDRYFELI